MATDPVSRDEPPPLRREDIRAARPYLLSSLPLRALARRVLSTAVLVVLDVVGLALGLYGALVLRAFLFDETVYWALLWRDGAREWLPFLIPITLLVFWHAGLYADRERRSGLGRVLSSLVLVTAVTVAFALGNGHEFTTYGLLPTACVTCALAIGLLRAAYDSVIVELQRVLRVRRRAVLVGGRDNVAGLHRTLVAARGGVAYDFAGAVGDEAPPGLRQLGTLDGLAAILAETRPDELILSEGDFDEHAVLEIVEAAHRAGVKVRLAPKTTDLLIQRGEYVPGQGAPLFELRPPVFAGADWVVKKAFDLVVSSLVVLVGLPLWLLIALAIRLDSRGPVLYRDRRIGVGEREFGMLKFRTMVQGAAELQDELEDKNEAEGALFKIRGDPRVTRVGSVLRRLSLDELPQVLNVLGGQMSLVGPRPLPVRDYRRLEGWHRRRYNVLPGITGLWQISGRSSLTFDDLVRLDFYYIENWSIWLDISILVKTLP
ncbi:MAG TPA: exopolysaccharide biosynthesis polyprenyl glycosylphosphotransferase, partial [Gaiellaceae bacterium]|nr:exopolysaccharide biosynthesis polyprenyl glycosylphosphotransferase [Gaiellaceae bacterium]